jgi:hypothetical protein
MGSGGVINIQSFMKIVSGVETILKFCVSNLTLMLVLPPEGIYKVRR